MNKVKIPSPSNLHNFVVFEVGEAVATGVDCRGGHGVVLSDLTLKGGEKSLVPSVLVE